MGGEILQGGEGGGIPALDERLKKNFEGKSQAVRQEHWKGKEC